MKTTPNRSAKLSERGQPCPREPKSRNSRTKLSALLTLAAINASLLMLGPISAHAQGGVPLWTNRYKGGGRNDRPTAIALDSSGNVFLTGFSWNGINNEYVTIKYSSSVPPPRLDFQLLNNQLVLSWTNAGFNLEPAPAVTGPFTNLPAATSPYTNALAAPQQFFRLSLL